MIHQFIQPSSHLRPYIKKYLLLHFKFDRHTEVPVKPFPANPDHNLVFYIRGDVKAFDLLTGTSTTFPKVAINGQQVSPFDFHLSPDYLMLAVFFHPGALSKFLRLPLTEFINHRIDAEAILNPAIHQVYEQLVNATNYQSMIIIVKNYLWRRIQNLKSDFQPIDEVSRLMAKSNNPFLVKQWANHACLSLSQFERRFKYANGVSPKFFLRINRFYSAFKQKDQNPNLNWLSIAFDSDYNDYQHLVKDFKQFAGSTPNTLIEAQAQAPERFLGLD